MKTRVSFIFIVLLICVGLLPKVEAVSPPPDGGYPGLNTAEGQNALLSLTSGVYNTAVGFSSLKSNTIGNANTAIGVNALSSNTSGYNNTANGVNALYSNTTGYENTANGVAALFRNTTGVGNTATGASALVFNTSGNDNTAVGAYALLEISPTATPASALVRLLRAGATATPRWVAAPFGATSVAASTPPWARTPASGCKGVTPIISILVPMSAA